MPQSGKSYAAKIGDWLLCPAQERFATCGALLGELFNDKGLLKYQSNLEKKVDGLAALAEEARCWLESVAEQAMLLELVALVTPALEVGRKFALAWDEAKAREGLVDFDDLIRQAALLLQRSDMAAWIRYKLDRRFDHVLVDEAQDTNAEQWAIIDALTDDFFAGMGQKDDRLRTMFVVGDYKQAIFGFQGTSPENFNRAFKKYWARLRERREAAAQHARQCLAARFAGPRAGPILPHRAKRAHLRRCRDQFHRPSPRWGWSARPIRMWATIAPASSRCGSPSPAGPKMPTRRRTAPNCAFPNPNGGWPMPSPRRSSTGSIPALRWRRAPAATPGRAISWCWCASGANWQG